ncbi:AAA family ATPase [Vibrio coralliilyticus]|uniref:ATP-dependent nuclease n=1 Tax=Vibrio coralliilyticus TaxID=190893 RepID=UPI00148C651D|nr:ATP-binding protein [Vibrio coralliilyticus]NOH53641.1 AAA family ATPase [Vibrio coralliilyticus]
MSIIRHVEIQNFRSIKHFSWNPRPGLNCLIGPGDSGKSTVLDAIDLALGARRSYSFNDADFYQLDTTAPLVITVTIGGLHDELKNVERYGFFLRGFNPATKEIYDEPQVDTETVLTVKLSVDADLAPDWQLYSERADADGLERRLPWKHRELLSPARLGATSQQNLAWGNRSVLNKLSEDTLDMSSVLAQLGRQTRNAFAAQQVQGVAEVLTQVQEIANGIGVPVGQLHALLDVNGISMSNGAISLHNSDGTPLRQLGTGSSRLLISGIQKAASCSSILIVDEAEYGLEPYRITRLLNELGSKITEPTQQVFLTTHSPYVLRELQAPQLHVLRKQPIAAQAFECPQSSHKIYSLEGGEQQQAALRACAEAFFSKAIIVGEGSTEVGFVRGIDLYKQDNQQLGIQSKGGFCTDGGGGNNYFQRAKVFAHLGYPVALLKDSDINTQAHQVQTEQCREVGVTVFEWGYGMSTEGAIFSWCRLDVLPLLVRAAADLNGHQEVDQHIKNKSNNQFDFATCVSHPQDYMRNPIAQAAGHYKWFKNIAKSETVIRNVVGPNTQLFNEHFQSILNGLLNWVEVNGDIR